ncbi:uncharacterized protein LOC129321529 [Prosopis cineraria]|uniref:uncharacterized protein LOC129321529 n=1 Tax=Prosopis cineraria TaxID=364024 RepID=UPI0024107FFD|nr:uncharacterized protein LOC129321529 [Prosopis cineraria]XP_054823293.1 uncharacterized protein LOC129321529 [Prosopis cineraria]
MDYDDNESRNLHLAGEGSTKFPPVLRPYALPKFEFDENLQGHLRFDSLVETEAFLGIESHEDNQWIDAFSRGSSGIEFSSAAAESCSISRHNNVWSEATSSESVEMLLKSVGQEELIPRQVVEESDACDELACLTKQMKPNPKSDVKSVLEKDVKDLHPPAVIHGSLSGLKEEVGRELSQAHVSQGHGVDSSIIGSSSNLESNDMCRNINLPVSEGSLYTDGKCNEVNQVVGALADDSLDDKVRELSTSGVQANASVASLQSNSSTCDVLNNQNLENCVIGIGDVQQGCLPAKFDKQDMKSSTLNKDAHVDAQTSDGIAAASDAHSLDKQPLCSVSTEQALEGVKAVEGLDAGMNGVVSGSDLLEAKRCNEDISSKNSDGDAANVDAVIDDRPIQNLCDLPKAEIKGDTSSKGQLAETSNSNHAISSDQQPDVITIERNTYGGSNASKEKAVLNSDHPMEKEILVSQSEDHVIREEDNNIFNKSEGNSDNRVRDLSMVASSTKSLGMSGSIQTCENDDVYGQGEQENLQKDVSLNEEMSTKVPTVSSQKHCDISQSHLVDKGVGSSSLSAGSKETELTTSTALASGMAVNDSASKVMLENICPVPCKTMDAPPPSINVFSINEVTGNNNVPKNTSSMSAAVDVKQDSAKIVTEVATATGVGSTEKEAFSVNGTEMHASSDAFAKLSCKTVNNCLLVEGTSGAEKLSEPQGAQVDEVIRECASVSGVPSVPCGSTVKKSDEVAISFDKHDKERHEKSSSKLSGDILHASQVSRPSAPLPDSHVALQQVGDVSTCTANITSSSSITAGNSSRTDNDRNQVKASTDQNPSVSEGINRDASATDVPSIGSDSKESKASKNDKSLTSEVNPMTDLSKTGVTNLTTKDVRKSQSLPAAVASKASTVEVSPTTSVLGPTKTKTAGDISHRINASKGTSERKTRRTYNKTPRKESSRKGSVAKEATPARQPERGDKSSNVSLSPSSSLQLMQSSEMQQYGHIDSSSTKPFPFLNASTSGLPDLNTSASPSVLSQQPFTDLQQVQLRAQIFVYGALIQGMAPDEAYMISAFGGPGGGRSMWEKAWRACIERQLGEKSHSLNLEAPQLSRCVKQSTLQGNAISSPSGLASSNATPPIVNPLMSLSSPLWTIPTPCDSLQSSALARGSVVDYPQALTSLHPYQTSPLRNFLGHNTSWISQAPLHGPWIASSTPPPGNSSHPSASPVSGTVKLSSVKGSPLPPSSGMKNVISSIPSSTGGPQSMLVATAPLHNTNVTVSPAQHSSDPKPKKRKKVLISEDLSQKALQSQSQLELTSAVSSHISTSIAITTAVSNVPKTNTEKSVVSVSTLSPADHAQNDKMIEKRALSDESLGKVKEAIAHAEEAAASSAAAVCHSLEIWNQLDKQKNSGLVSDIEAKLASAAIAVAAAAAVAKAAAAASNVASNAALQAKLMADEALISSGNQNPCQSIELSDSINKFGKATPASILRGTNGTNNSIMVAAKEAVRRRVEAASVAVKQAENMEAIVKAAELAAEAVSRAGKLVTMGDPLPFSDLIDAAPEGFRSVAQASSQEVGLLKEMTRGLVNFVNAGDSPETSHTLNKDGFSDEMEKQMATNEQPPFHKLHNEKLKDHMRPIDSISISINGNGKNTRGPKVHKVSEPVTSIDVVPESDIETRLGNESDKLEEKLKEGSLIEVFKDGEGWKAAWYTANVLSLKDGDAYVCYTSLVADGGAGPLKEWIAFKGEVDKPPRIRIARPLTDLHHEGTRKRRRAAMGDFAWSIGDRVDAWIEESWREGVVTGIKKDETFTVHFPATEETSVVRACYLRPSQIWKDGKWTECSRVGANDHSTHEGDTPLEKRLKLGGPMNDELRLLDLTENQKVFNIGKASKNEHKPDTHRTARTGLQKEGSRVIFGVPKPGKKRKFMEVSKHYVADRSNKINDGNDSVKLANFLMPQVPGSRGWKSNSKNDAKEKRGANPKYKTSKPEKSHIILDRSIPPQDNILANAFSQSNDTERIKDANHFKNASDNRTQLETASYSSVDGVAEGPILFSSLPTSVDAPSSKKTSTSRASKGKLAPAGGKLDQIEEEKVLNSDSVKSTSEIIEPRRSNRRIQPTSRLLEGLQSSLIITKVPSVSHDKSHKNQSRNASRG